MTMAVGGAPPAVFFDPDQLRDEGDGPYREFLRVPSLSSGIYRLRAGEQDLQKPHDEDEVYYVIGGRARFTAGEQTQPVSAGSLLFVRAGVEHRFHDIVEDLEILVFFSSAPSR